MSYHPSHYYNDDGTLQSSRNLKNEHLPYYYHNSPRINYLKVHGHSPLPGKPVFYNPDHDTPAQFREYYAKWENTGVDDNGVYQPIDKTKPSLTGSREQEREDEKKRKESESSQSLADCVSSWITPTPVEKSEPDQVEVKVQTGEEYKSAWVTPDGRIDSYLDGSPVEEGARAWPDPHYLGSSALDWAKQYLEKRKNHER